MPTDAVIAVILYLHIHSFRERQAATAAAVAPRMLGRRYPEYKWRMIAEPSIWADAAPVVSEKPCSRARKPARQ